MVEPEDIETDHPIDRDSIRITFPCLRARQPIGDLFTGVIKYDVLEMISYFDVRRRLQRERDVERYLGIQRPLEPRRVDALKKYVTFADASFPTSIIIAIDEEYVQFSEQDCSMNVSNTREGEAAPSTAIRKLA